MVSFRGKGGISPPLKTIPLLRLHMGTQQLLLQPRPLEIL